ncbi:MAG: aa3-type cytochrome oxidase subunit CtaJ [Sciscionella sp.]
MPETILIYVVIPAAVYGFIALLTMGGKRAKVPRFRSGQDWPYPPVWWSGNPAGVGHQTGHGVGSRDAHDAAGAVAGSESAPSRTAFGGARGGW